jgi:tRNA dimethylallyltransferase
VSRALEIFFQSGKKVSTILPRNERFQTKKFFLDLSAEELREKIHIRTDMLIENGWIDEVRGLLKRYKGFEQLPAAAALGYREVIDYLRGEISLDDCKRIINRKTWQYARRQRTWFRNQDQFTSIGSSAELQKKVDSVLQ